MGGFIHLTALRVTDPHVIADAVVRYAAAHGVPAAAVPPGADTAPDTAPDVAPVLGPDNGWSTVAWPTYFTGAAKATRWLSGELGVVASLCEYYDGDDWTHMAFDRGEVRDRFASYPAGQTSELTTLAEAERRWAGNAAVVAELFDRRAEEIGPYFARSATQKAWPDDQFDLDDPWVFVDFWRRLGITYPDGPAHAVTVRFASPGSAHLPYDTSTD